MSNHPNDVLTENYTLLLGDCLSRLRDVKVKPRLVLTDLPYGTTKCSWDNVIPFTSLWGALNPVIEDTTAVLLFGTEPFSSFLRVSNITAFKYDWVWEKSKATGFLNSKKQPLRAHEIISVFYKKQPLYNPQMAEGGAYDKGVRKQQTQDDVYSSFNPVRVSSVGGRYPRTVFYSKTAEREGGYHKTQKPVKLLEYLIQTYTLEGDYVLDFTMGSGSTGVACLNTNRRFLGIEKDVEFFNIAKERLLVL